MDLFSTDKCRIAVIQHNDSSKYTIFRNSMTGPYFLNKKIEREEIPNQGIGLLGKVIST